MPRFTLPLFFVAAAVAVGAPSPAHSEPVPAPKEELKDYHALGVIQLEIPTSSPDPTAKPVPFTAWFPFRQGYVRPDRMLMVMNVAGAIQLMLVSGDSESQFSPSAGYVVRRTYKNADPSSPAPMLGSQLSMATYARALREITTGKLLPDEDLDKLKVAATARIEELRKLRELLAQSKEPESVARVAAAAGEQARLRDELLQIDIRKVHPCHVMEFENRDVLRSLFARGLIGDTTTEFLARGKTTVWITKAEGLPIKVETSANDGRVAIYVAFTELRVNQGMHPNELGLGAPRETQLIAATADLRDRNWQEKLDKEIARQIDLIDRQRQKSTAPPVRPKPKRSPG
jgi:hypothetical protein